MEVAVQNQPVGALTAQEHFEKQKRPFVVKGNLEIVGDDGHLIDWRFCAMDHRLSAWQPLSERRGGRVCRVGFEKLLRLDKAMSVIEKLVGANNCQGPACVRLAGNRKVSAATRRMMLKTQKARWAN